MRDDYTTYFLTQKLFLFCCVTTLHLLPGVPSRRAAVAAGGLPVVAGTSPRRVLGGLGFGGVVAIV